MKYEFATVQLGGFTAPGFPRLGGTNGRQGKHGYWLSVTGASMSDVARIRVTVTLALPLLLR